MNKEERDELKEQIAEYLKKELAANWEGYGKIKFLENSVKIITAAILALIEPEIKKAYEQGRADGADAFGHSLGELEV